MDDNSGGSDREGLLPVSVQGEDPEGESDHERGPHCPPGAGPGPVDHDPDRAGEHRSAHEPFASDELLWGDAAGDVDQIPPGGGADHGQEQATEHGRPTFTPFWAPTMAYQGREKAVMNWKIPSLKSWPPA